MPTSLIRPWLDGRPAPHRARDVVPVRRPWDGRLLARVALANEADLEAAVTGAERAGVALRALPAHRRRALLLAVAGLLARQRSSLARLIADDAGKPLTLALGEVDRAVQTFTAAAEELRGWTGEWYSADVDPRGEGYVALAQRFPIGLIAAISPFNFPLNLAAHKLAPAIAVGAPVVLKAPPQAPLTAFRLAGLLAAAGLPPGAVQVLHLPLPLAERLATDPRFAMLSFTGSAAVGWHLKSVAGRKKVLLELGGNAAAVVHEDALDLSHLARRVAWGAFAYGGQVCIKVQRLYVHQSIYRRFVQAVVAATRALPVGDPRLPETVVGPLIDDAAADRVSAWVREAIAEGARPLLRGARRGRLLWPTILEGADPRSKVSCQEVFGPVLVVAPYRTWDEAIRLVNDSEFGLQAGVFTRDAGRVFQAFAEVAVGGLVVNDLPTLRLDHLPYGGVKASGLGREGLREAMRAMTELRLLLWRPQGSP